MMNSKKIISILTFLTLFLVPVFASDNSVGFDMLSQMGDKFSEITGIPHEFIAFPNLIYYVIIPFIAVFALMEAVLAEINIFQHQQKLNKILAFSVAAIAMGTGGLWYAVNKIILLTAGFSAVAVGIIAALAFGSWFLVKWRKHGGNQLLSKMQNMVKKDDKAIAQTDAEIQAEEKKLEHETDPAKRTEIENEIISLKEQVAKYEKEKKDQEDAEAKKLAASKAEDEKRAAAIKKDHEYGSFA